MTISPDYLLKALLHLEQRLIKEPFERALSWTAIIFIIPIEKLRKEWYTYKNGDINGK